MGRFIRRIGLADTLYMVDNNDGRYDARGTIRAMKVKYLPYSSSNSELYPYVPNSLGDFTIRIESLCTLSFGPGMDKNRPLRNLPENRDLYVRKKRRNVFIDSFRRFH